MFSKQRQPNYPITDMYRRLVIAEAEGDRETVKAVSADSFSRAAANRVRFSFSFTLLFEFLCFQREGERKKTPFIH